MGQGKIKKVRRVIRREFRAQWTEYLNTVASWSFRERLRFARLILFPPRRNRRNAERERKRVARKAQRRRK